MTHLSRGFQENKEKRRKFSVIQSISLWTGQFCFFYYNFFQKQPEMNKLFYWIVAQLCCLKTTILKKKRYLKKEDLKTPQLFLDKAEKKVESCTAFWQEKSKVGPAENFYSPSAHYGRIYKFCPKIVSLLFQSCLFNLGFRQI